MRFQQVTTEIAALCDNPALSFSTKVAELQELLNSCSQAELLEHLDYAGVIPESFEHDSTEEKLFAKYCDALLAQALSEIGLRARTIQERADAADVFAEAESYTIVGDAKAFRLSRTAKNQKDFKVEALDQWRRGAEYSCLVCPLYQYPHANSQIYQQATRYRVTLLSYTHLAFLIRKGLSNTNALRTLWETPRTLRESKSAQNYWTAVDRVMLEISASTPQEWEAAREEVFERLTGQAQEQIRYWESKRAAVLGLRREVAVEELVKAMKIDEKIQVIRQFCQD